MTMEQPTISYTTLTTPLGPMLAAAENDALTGLWFEGQRWFPKLDDNWRRDDGLPLFAQVARQLDEYFAGRRGVFDVPLAPRGSRATQFQRAVWSAIAAVPLGATSTYRSLAASCGNARGVRAAGAATGRNPISLIIPCHRIVGSDGSLTGYAGGLERKRALLAHEAALGGRRGVGATG
jgi:methylated-DNA-[protein]-cysteine S-methyltransferase